jgi:hypothetical protein
LKPLLYLMSKRYRSFGRLKHRRHLSDERRANRSFAACRALMNSEMRKFGGVDRPSCHFGVT